MSRKLPLAWNWYNRNRDWQLAELESGQHVIPTIGVGAREFSYWRNKDGSESTKKLNDAKVIKKAAELGVPMVFRANNVMYKPDTFTWFKQFGFNPLEYKNHAWTVFEKKITAAELENMFPEGVPALPAKFPGRDHYVIRMHADGSATYLDTFTKHISMWSDLSGEWAHQLGFLYATTDVVREAAKLYPNPPIVLFADNDEIGQRWNFQDPDVRQPKNLRDAKKWLWQFGDIKDIKKGQEDYLESRCASATIRGWEGKYKSAAVNMIFDQFNLGFEAGLKTHNRHWAEVAGWMNYSQVGEERSISVYGKLDQNTLSRSQTGLQNGKHKYGGTGSLYLHPWYGQWNCVRSIGAISLSKTYRDFSSVSGGWKPRLCLMWENRDTRHNDKPNRDDWNSIVESEMWIHGTEYVGHWVAHGTKAGHEKLEVYWDQVKKAVAKVHDDALLRRYWFEGDIMQSVDPTPRGDTGVDASYPWYLHHVAINGRYYQGKNTPPEELRTLTDAKKLRRFLWRLSDRYDGWQKSNKRLMKVLSWSRRIKNESEDKILLFAAGLKQGYSNVLIKLDIDNVVTDVRVDAPQGGALYEIENGEFTNPTKITASS